MPTLVMVTGAGGFLGRQVCDALRAAEFQVLATGRSGRFRSNYTRLNICQGVAARAFLSRHRPGAVVHCAGGRSDQPMAMYADNIFSFVSLLHAVNKVPNYSPRVIMVGSAAEYGQTGKNTRIQEHRKPSPVSLYGWIKWIQTKTALEAAAQGNDVMVARLFNVVGPKTPVDTAAGAFARQLRRALSAQSTRLQVGNLDGVRDFVDVRDAARAIVALIHKGQSGEIYNICSQKPVPLKKLLHDMLAEIPPRAWNIQIGPRMAGVPYSVGSNEKLTRHTGWKPVFEWRDSIRDTLTSYGIHENLGRA